MRFDTHYSLKTEYLANFALLRLFPNPCIPNGFPQFQQGFPQIRRSASHKEYSPARPSRPVKRFFMGVFHKNTGTFRRARKVVPPQRFPPFAHTFPPNFRFVQKRHPDPGINKV
jgi:hypothetical protein